MKLSDRQVNSYSDQMYFKKKSEENHSDYKKLQKLTIYLVKRHCLNLLQHFHGHKMQGAEPWAAGKIL